MKLNNIRRSGGRWEKVTSMGGVCVRLGKAKPPKIIQSLAPQTFGIAYEGFIFGQAIYFYIENGYNLSMPETEYSPSLSN